MGYYQGVMPFLPARIAAGRMELSQFEVFKENVAGSTHVTRSYEVAGTTRINFVASYAV